MDVYLGQKMKVKVTALETMFDSYTDMLRDGIVCYMHPQKRYITIQFTAGYRESYLFSDVSRFQRLSGTL